MASYFAISEIRKDLCCGVTKDLFGSTVNFLLAVRVLPVSWIHDFSRLFSHFGYLPERCICGCLRSIPHPDLTFRKTSRGSGYCHLSRPRDESGFFAG